MKKRLISPMLIVTVILALTALVVSAQDSEPPFLGIAFGESEDGALVTDVLRNGPAAKAGLEAGDIITVLNGEAVTAGTLADTVGNLSPGDTITLDVLRDGETIEIDATLGTQPEHRRFEIMPFRFERAWLGVNLAQTDDGIVIDSVADESPAAEAGLQAGDILTAIDGEAVETSAAAAATIRDLEPGDTVTLSITRDSEALEIDVTLGSMMNRSFDMMTGNDIVIFDGENWRIVALSDDSALAEAGLQAGDVVTAINGESLDSEGLATLLDDLAEDATVTITVERDGETQDIEAVPVQALNIFSRFNFGMGLPFGEFRGPRGDMPFSFDFAPGNARLGVQFTNIDADVAAENDLSVAEGALITDVLPDSPAEAAGLQAGDVVVSVDGDVVDAERTLRDRLFAYEPEDTVALEILRDNETLMLEVTLGGIEMENMPFDFEFGDDGALRFFFGPHGQFDFEHPPIDSQSAAQAPNA